ncbi:MAG: sugar ABC transporter ATP-binding protein [Planctomycetaceae bacterium]
MADPLLSMHGVSKRFGATRALDGVSFELRPGEVMALLGENGAGKSTLMKILSGALRPDAGRIELLGNPYLPRDPHAAHAAGVAMIYQELNLAPDLSVEDNVMLGQEIGRAGILRRGAQGPRVREALSRLGHSDLRPETPVGRLSVAVRQIVEIARALVRRARVIVFDEPTSSLTRSDAERLFDVIRRLKRDGIGIVYISHFLEEIRSVCGLFTVLRDGRTVGGGNVADVSNEAIVAQMVGRAVGELFPCVPHQPGETILSLADLSGRKSPRGVSLDLRRGEILGIAGLVGAGRTELLRCVYGLDPIARGEASLPRQRGEAGALPAGTRGRIAAGIGFVSEDRKQEGLAQERSLADNVTLSRLAPYSRCGWLALRRRDAIVGDWMRRLRIRARSPRQAVSELSGGNQQKAAIARVLHQEADVILLDEPTRGIDVATKADIYRLMGELAARGKAVLFVSSYFTELLAVCDRVAAMARGRIVDVRPASEWTEESLLRAAVATPEEAA